MSSMRLQCWTCGERFHAPRIRVRNGVVECPSCWSKGNAAKERKKNAAAEEMVK